MARGKPHRYRRFARGLNTADGAYNLRDGYEDDPTGLGAECRDVLNAVSKDRGNVSKRDGCTTLLSRTGIKDLSVVDEDTSGILIYSTEAGALYALDDALAETSLVASGLSATAPWTFLRLPTSGGQGPYYGMNGTDTPRYVTTVPAAATWTAATGTLPNGKFMVYAGNRLWVAGVSGNEYSLYWSEIGDPRNWPVANVTKFDPDDGEPITGLGVFGPYVLVFKERDIWRVYDLDTSANVKIADNVGTQSPRSIVSTEDGCYFLDPQRGVMITDGNETREIGRQILPTFQDITSSDLETVSAAFWNGHYYLAARFDGSTRRVLDYHQELKSWWVHSHQAKVLTVWDRGSGQHLLAGHPTTLARLFVPGELLDEDVIFRWYWSGPFHDFKAPHLLKRCRELQIDGRGIIDVYVQSDFYPGAGSLEGQLDFAAGQETFGGDGTFGGSGTFGGGTSIGDQSLRNLGVGRVWSITVGNESESTGQLDSYVLMMDHRKD